MADKARAALYNSTHCVLFAAGVVHNPDHHRDDHDDYDDDDFDDDDGDDSDDAKNRAFYFFELTSW